LTGFLYALCDFRFGFLVWLEKIAAEKAVRDCMTSVTSFPQLSVRVP
jgi:hypothetical protein